MYRTPRARTIIVFVLIFLLTLAGTLWLLGD